VLAADPVGEGLVSSIGRPGGNITGVRTGSVLAAGKRVERLKEAVPNLSSVAVVWNAKQPAMSRTLVQPTVDAARTLRMLPRVLGVENEVQLNAALDIIAREGLESLVLGPALSVAPDKFNLVPDFAARIKIPQIYADEEMVRKGGGLMSFNSNRAAQYQRAAEFVDKIWRGTRPADIPVEEPIEIDFIVNLAAAIRIGLDFPTSVVRLATEIIR
jgi:putative ABC transport system substrate-binding protein